MAISHLLRLKSASQITNKGNLRSRILYSSLISNGKGEENKPTRSKKSELAKQQKAQAIESFVNEYMKENQGVFPKATHVHNEVGGSWYSLKGLLQSVKEKLSGKSDEQNRSGAATSITDPKACCAIPSDKVDDNNGDEPQVHEHNEVVSEPASDNLKMESLNSSDFISSLKEALAGFDRKASSREGNYLQFDSISDFFGNPCNENMVQETSTSGDVKTEGVSLGSEAVVNSKSEEAKDETLRTLGRVFANECDKMRLKNSKTDGKKSYEKMESEDLISGVISAIKNQKSRLDEVSHFNSLLPTETRKEYQNVIVDEEGCSEFKDFLPKDNPLSQRTFTRTKMDKQSFAYDNSHEMKQLENPLVDSLEDGGAKGSANAVTNAYSPTSFQQSSEPSKDTSGTNTDIEGLIGTVMALPMLSVNRPQETKISSESDPSSDRTAIKGVEKSVQKPKFEKKKTCNSSTLDQGGLSPVNVPKSDKKEGKLSSLTHLFTVKKNDLGEPFKKLMGNLTTDDKETSCSAALDCDRSKSNTQREVLPLRDDGNLNATPKATSSQKESDQNKVMVKFLHKAATREDIIEAFKTCGYISEVVISNTEDDYFNTAYINFRSDEGMKNALERTDVMVRNLVVTVNAASSSKTVKNTCIPDLIGIPDVPTTLVKNPKQTVMITKLTHDIRPHHIKEALSFCNSKITRVFSGSSSTDAFVEFETEEGKENALTRHSINILGRRLSVLRVDVPRTTVVRVSNLGRLLNAKVIAHCKSLGKVRRAVYINNDTRDVHFSYDEWPNMVKILNSLNGSNLEGQSLIAQSAPVYPPDILEALWNDPEGRQHLQSAFHNLLKKVGGIHPSEYDMSELADGLFEDSIRS